MIDYLIKLDLLLLDISDYCNLNNEDSLSLSEDTLIIINKHIKKEN